MKLISFLILLSFYSCSCQEEIPNYTKEEMLEWAREADPGMKIEVGDLSKALVDCKDYTPNCRIGYKVVLKDLKFNALYYEVQENASICAKRIRGYQARNWVFDEVRGEPVLERIVVKYLKAEPAF
jgi:hypothetical protein